MRKALEAAPVVVIMLNNAGNTSNIIRTVIAVIWALSAGVVNFISVVVVGSTHITAIIVTAVGASRHAGLAYSSRIKVT
jgi:mannitol-1-phosphate/altronate dehydrogenase